MRAFLRRFRIEHAIVRDDADRIAADPRKTRDERGPVTRLEFIELARVHDPRYHLANIVRFANVGIDHAVQLFRRIARLPGRRQIEIDALLAIQRADDLPRDGERVKIVVREMVGDTGDSRMDIGATEIFRGNNFAGRGLDEWRTAEKDRPLSADDDRFVGHRRDIRAARRARAHHRGDLRNAFC